MSTKQKDKTDPYEAVREYCRHISTLCTGSILVIVTFLANFEGIPEAQENGSYAIIFIACAVVSALVAQGFSLFLLGGGRTKLVYLMLVMFIITFAVLLFITGVYYLTDFTSENIGRQIN